MSVTTQLETMLAMIGMGGWLGLSIDTYSRFLQRRKRARFIVFINDVLFWLLQGLIIFYVLLLVNEGELRVYIFLAILCGYAAYQSLLRSLYLRLLEMLIRFFTALFRFFVRTCYYIVVRPIQGLLHLLLLLLLVIWKLILSTCKLLYRCVIFLLMPVFWLIKWLWMMVPLKQRETIAKFFDWAAGVVQRVKNIIIKRSSKFRK
ncbi:spore cortex biosynthesis protein YabQ [Anoxybacillus rupiensis]|jgi:spore cortex biosynthesis protein YabQ|uniref:Spore cortex biosynthesis protein YabQ n=1 Tax=Anoxybacteroides rupiense TaxID=311460 RepID=A0ABT5W9Y9_9BACL|nr:MULTISPECIES: spore cortex biosynthesis protein YabQ [Anoxybacillus]MBB3909148.1 spore cortex biosynthesis protein YabQ [Anoxybacillus rupiensis]MDE8565390.1 spore cortex biosynthesis protein YabQ [Anoxybacillus rupiensis]OQM47107.1 spore cortex biosynthesis protein YabQ [Anoxybacillus sp. UARK-01]